MKVENIPLNEFFVVETIIPLKRVLIEVVNTANLPKGEPSTTSLLATGSLTRMIDTTNPPMADLPPGLISTIFGIVKSPACQKQRKLKAMQRKLNPMLRK